MDAKQTYCVGALHKSNTVDMIGDEKMKTNYKKSLTLEKENVMFADDLNQKFFITKPKNRLKPY